MGNCNCIEDTNNEEEHIIHAKFIAKSKAKNKNNTLKQSTITEVYESTNFKSCNNIENKEVNDSFKLINYKIDTPPQELENTPRPEVVKEAEEEDDYDYVGLAKEIFNSFNKIRLNPSKFESKISNNKSKYLFLKFRIKTNYQKLKKRKVFKRRCFMVAKITSNWISIL